MTRTPEGQVKRQIKKILRAWGVQYLMFPGSSYGAPGLDFVCCWLGFFLAIEAKKPGAQATARQAITMQTIRTAGGTAMLIDGTNYNQLEKWLMDKAKMAKEDDELAGYLHPIVWQAARDITAKYVNSVSEVKWHNNGWDVTFLDETVIQLTSEEALNLLGRTGGDREEALASPEQFTGIAKLLIAAGGQHA